MRLFSQKEIASLRFRNKNQNLQHSPEVTPGFIGIDGSMVLIRRHVSVTLVGGFRDGTGKSIRPSHIHY